MGHSELSWVQPTYSANTGRIFANKTHLMEILQSEVVHYDFIMNRALFCDFKEEAMRIFIWQLHLCGKSLPIKSAYVVIQRRKECLLVKSFLVME